MNNIKQVIVWRKDLKVRRGKQMAQSAHASLKVFTDKFEKPFEPMAFTNTSTAGKYRVNFLINKEEKDWLEGMFTKIVVSVDSEQELLDVYNKAKMVNLPCALIEDNGLTEFHGVKTITCCAIGPADSEKIDEITGELPLF